MPNDQKNQRSHGDKSRDMQTTKTKAGLKVQSSSVPGARAPTPVLLPVLRETAK